MCKESDQALFPGRTIFDDLVADQECLDAGFGEVRHKSYSSEVLCAVKKIRVSLESDGLRIRWEGGYYDRTVSFRKRLSDEDAAATAFHDLSEHC